MILSDTDQSSLETVCADLVKSSNHRDLTTKIFVANVSDYEQMKAFAFFVEAEFGKVDLLINNAGTALGAFFSRLYLERYATTF